MATFRLAPRKHSSESNHVAIRIPSPSPKLASEDEFLRLLRLERRRTERSGRAFLLILISSPTMLINPHGEQANSTVNALGSCIRETDVLGWYEEGITLGLLMTEIGEAAAESIECIVQKISTTLEKSLQVETYCRLAVVVHVFPDNDKNSVFYQDIHPRQGRDLLRRRLKRTIDIAGSLFALALFSPLFVLIAILVKWTSKGPILYCKQRVGEYGREFNFYKFRTMVADNDPHIHREYVSKLIAGGANPADTEGLYKMKNDPRVTRIGKFLRRTSLDELPQFFNVLKNDMSLVGPRPPLPYEYERYRTWHRRRVLEQKPGITGLWQIEGRSRTTFDEMVRMDIRYAMTCSVWMDLKILFLTPGAMFGKGAV